MPIKKRNRFIFIGNLNNKTCEWGAGLTSSDDPVYTWSLNYDNRFENGWDGYIVTIVLFWYQTKGKHLVWQEAAGKHFVFPQSWPALHSSHFNCRKGSSAMWTVLGMLQHDVQNCAATAASAEQKLQSNINKSVSRQTAEQKTDSLWNFGQTEGLATV